GERPARISRRPLPLRTRGRCRSPIYLDAPERLVAGATRAQIRALDELVLELAHVRVLRSQLDLVGLPADDLLDPVARLLERLVLGPAAQLDHRRERARNLGRGVRSRDVERDALRFGVAESRRFAPVIVLERDDDVGLVGLAHD